MTTRVLIGAVALIGALALPGAAQAAKGIDAHCGFHRGKLVWRSVGHEQFRIRIGPKVGRVGGSHRCHGYYKRRTGNLTGGGVLDWHPFDLPNVRWKLIADVAAKTGVTIGACGAFATSLFAELPSAGAATIIIAGSAGGCYQGVSSLYDSRNDIARLRK